MAKVRKRVIKSKDGKETVRWIADITTLTGERVRPSFKTKADAESYMIKALATPGSVACNKDSRNLTLVDACNNYIRYHAEVRRKKSTCADYRSYLANHIQPFFKNCKLHDVNIAMVEQFVRLKVDEKLSNSTINHFLAFIKAVFQKMFNNGKIQHNPLSRVEKLRVNNKKFEVLTPKEVDILLNTAKKHYPDYYPLIFTALATGMRQGELFALQWDRLDWQNKKILIDLNYTKYNLDTPKSNKSRVVDMTEGLMQVLQEWQGNCPASDKNLVFPNAAGNYHNPSNLTTRVFHPLIKKAGVKQIRFHDLRHTFVSLHISQNSTPKFIQSQVGHSSINMTLDTYGHILPEVREKSANALDSILKPVGTKLAQNVKILNFQNRRNPCQ